MTGIGKPFAGKAWYWTETAYSGGNAGSSKLISDCILDVKIDTGEKSKKLQSFNSSTLTDWISAPSDPTLHVEWVLQNTTYSLATECVTRTSTCSLHSLAFCVGLSTCEAPSTYYYLKGCVAKNFNIKGSTGMDNEYICSADFSVASLTVSGTVTGTAPSGANGAYAQFITAGSIFKDTTVALAYITNSIDITVNNNLKDYWNVGYPWKKAAIPGAQEITGSCDISMDNGGNAQMDLVLKRTPMANIILDTGIAAHAYHKYTLTDVIWNSLSVDGNISGDAIISSVPFTAKTITIGT